MKKILTFVVALTLCYSVAKAQNFQVHGNIVSGDKPLDAATITLLKTDSTILKHSISDKNGEFDIKNINEGNYLICIKVVGNQTYYSNSVYIKH